MYKHTPEIIDVLVSIYRIQDVIIHACFPRAQERSKEEEGLKAFFEDALLLLLLLFSLCLCW